MRFAETKVSKEEFYGAKKTIKIWDVDVNNMAIWKLVEMKNSCKYLIEYLDYATRPLVLILSKMSGYVKTFKLKDEDKEKNNKLMSFHIDGDKLLEKYITICTMIEDLKILNWMVYQPMIIDI